MPRYYVTKVCQWGGRLWDPASPVEKDRVYSGSAVPPAEYFSEVEPERTVETETAMTLTQLQGSMNGSAPVIPQAPVAPAAPGLPQAPVAPAAPMPVIN